MNHSFHTVWTYSDRFDKEIECLIDLELAYGDDRSTLKALPFISENHYI
jgi:hypothetical protein